MSHDPNTERASDSNPQNRSEIGVSDSTPAPKNDGRFKPGNNANPGGRPAIAKEFKGKCRQFMSDKGWHKLIEMAQSNSRDARPALELITGYAYGRPVHERVCGQYAPCARLAAFNDYKPTPRGLHPTMTTIERESQMSTTTTPDGETAGQCQVLVCSECGELTYPELSDAEVNALVDDVHGPCFDSIARVTDVLTEVCQPGALWFNAETSGTLLSVLNGSHAIAEYVCTTLEAGGDA